MNLRVYFDVSNSKIVSEVPSFEVIVSSIREAYKSERLRIRELLLTKL